MKNKRKNKLEELFEVANKFEIYLHYRDPHYNDLKWVKSQIKKIRKIISILNKIKLHKNTLIKVKESKNEYLLIDVDLQRKILFIKMEIGFKGDNLTDCIDDLIDELEFLESRYRKLQN